MNLNTIFPLFLLYIFPFILHLQPTQGKSLLLQTLERNNAINSSSPWLARLNNPRPPSGCWRQPWVCGQGQPPGVRVLCCQNRCVDVTYDINNCGQCGRRCRFTSQCCRGRCVNTNRNRNHCGKCDNRCGFRRRCLYGMCGYAQPDPPHRPPRPRPPHRPPRPRPPHRPPRPHDPRSGGKHRPPSAAAG